MQRRSMRRALCATNACGLNVEDVSNVQDRAGCERALDQGDVTLTVRALRIGQCGGGVMTTPARYSQNTPARNPPSTSAIQPRPSRKCRRTTPRAGAVKTRSRADLFSAVGAPRAEVLTAPSTASFCPT